MDERIRLDRDGSMWHGNGQFSHRQLAGVVALAALIAGPLAIPATATALPVAASAESHSAYSTGSSVAETPSQAALRTSTALAGIVIGTAALVAVWWLVVVRNRRRD